jgi:DNA-binding transcriptional ArsR family regulator/uncharacterized protein YndB with AHSA1/START domain
VARRSEKANQRSEAVWTALADPTRRAILDLLRQRPRTLGDIADCFAVSRFAIRKHLNALERAQLVVVRWTGRERWNYLNVVPLQAVYERWVTPYQAIWGGRLSRLKTNLEGETKMPSTSASECALQRVEFEVHIAAPAANVWRALTEQTTFWWPKPFYTGPALGFHLEAKIGGRLYEDWGSGAGVIWYEVFGLNPGVSLDLRGNLGVTFGPAVSLLHLELVPRKGLVVFKVSEATIGTAGDLAEKTSGWEQIFGSLKAHVEGAR